MLKKYPIYALAFVLWFAVACQEKHVTDSKAVKEELRQREVVHLTSGQISERAFELGDTILTKAEKEFIQTLALVKDSSCIPAFQAVQKEYNQMYKAEINRYSLEKPTFPTTVTGKEKLILEAYAFNKKNGLPILPNFQKDGETGYFFTKALTLNDKSCLSCHAGVPGSSAKQLGDTLGVWSVKYTKKQVVMSFVD